MSDEFKKRMESYEKGELSAEEAKEIEKELESMERYLEETDEENRGKLTDSDIGIKKQQRIMKFAKWKARFQTALMAIGLFLLFSFFSSILTLMYYSFGAPDRVKKLRNIVDYSLTVMNPYGHMDGTSTSTSAYFGMTASKDINKVIGDDTIKVGEMETDFFFSRMSYPEVTYFSPISINSPAFIYPGSSPRGFSGWERLKKVPEGTVVSAYVSFTDLLETEEVFSLFETKDMRLIWLAVDTGFEKKETK
ncbi:anti-sigma factor [Bacillus sp. D386]|uniref:anti-sigma factor n=1 Tax=Bacillus sp. D386 TaxID=2587155 RepID=UPI00214C0884|nr:anti-sigma factor [Bacillus sp. D386]